MPDKRVDSRARIRVNQLAAFTVPARARPVNTKIPRTKKHSTKRRKLQITSWVDEPLMLQLAAKARKRDLSMSTTVRRLLRKVLTTDDGEVDAALDAEMMGERMESGIRALSSRLAFLLVWLIYDVGYIKLLSSSTLGMQKDMTPQLLKDIFQQADRKTTAALSRKRPELTPLVKAVEKWLSEAEEQAPRSPGANGKSRRGGRGV